MNRIFTPPTLLSPIDDVSSCFHDLSGKKRRLTFMECNNDINTMIDLAKVADLVSVNVMSDTF